MKMHLCWMCFLVFIVMIHGESYGPDNKDELALSANPRVIEPGLTRSFQLNCTLENSEKRGKIISMSFAKETGPDDAGKGGDIAGISTFGNHLSKVGPGLDADVSGDISQKTSGFLGMFWKDPSSSLQGTYICRAVLLNEPFGMSMLNAKVKVTYRVPQMSSVIRRLGLLESNLKHEAEGLKDEIKDLKTENENLKNEVKGLKHDDEKLRHNDKSLAQDLRERHGQLTKTTSSLLNKISSLEKSQYWISKPWNGRRYYLSHFIHSTSVRQYDLICASLGGYLFEPDTKKEFEFVIKFINTYPEPVYKGNLRVLIGATDEGHEGTWRTIHSGKRVRYLKWAPRQPDNHGGKEHCVEYLQVHSALNDMPCQCNMTPVWRYLCEVPL